MPVKSIINIINLKKEFIIPHEKHSSLKSTVLNFYKKRKYDRFYVLDDLSFEIKQGEFVGIVGRNGSGKSTLLKIMAGIYNPTSGTVKVGGSITPFIELGIGFNPELTGRENVFLNAAILGLSQNEIEKKYSSIVEFSGLGRFMDQKLKNYSSGMQVRLSFSIAIQAHSDILLIDEVLAVGDASFQRKCFEIFKDIKKSKKTVIFVSHDMGAVKEYCDRAILIENGKILSEGSPEKVSNDYIQLFNEEATIIKEHNRWGDQRLTLENIKITLEKKSIIITYDIKPNHKIVDPIFGVIIKNSDNISLIDTNTKWRSMKTGTLVADKKYQITWVVENNFKNDEYFVTVAAAYEDGTKFYDWRENIGKFRVTGKQTSAGQIISEKNPTICAIESD